MISAVLLMSVTGGSSWASCRLKSITSSTATSGADSIASWGCVEPAPGVSRADCVEPLAGAVDTGVPAVVNDGAAMKPGRRLCTAFPREANLAPHPLQHVRYCGTQLRVPSTSAQTSDNEYHKVTTLTALVTNILTGGTVVVMMKVTMATMMMINH